MHPMSSTFLHHFLGIIFKCKRFKHAFESRCVFVFNAHDTCFFLVEDTCWFVFSISDFFFGLFKTHNGFNGPTLLPRVFT